MLDKEKVGKLAGLGNTLTNILGSKVICPSLIGFKNMCETTDSFDCISCWESALKEEEDEIR